MVCFPAFKVRDGSGWLKPFWVKVPKFIKACRHQTPRHISHPQFPLDFFLFPLSNTTGFYQETKTGEVNKHMLTKLTDWIAMQVTLTSNMGILTN